MKNIESKSKKLLIILTPIVLLVIVVGFSYAYWRKTVSQEGINRIDTLKCLETTITDESSAINLENEYPIPNSEGMTKSPYTFKVTNMCNIFISADIALEVLPVSTLNAQYVRASLNDKGATIDNSNILTNYPLGTATIEGGISRILKSVGMIDPNSSVSYDLRIWLDEATTTEQGANKRFESKIVVTVSPKTAPVHLTVNFPTNLSGAYTTSFEGATWNQKFGRLEIENLNGEQNNISLTNEETTGAVNLADYIISLASDSVNTGVYNENGYRYEGKSPNNWIMFNGEYWRIIGVFDSETHGQSGQNLVKIIRDSSIGTFSWNKTTTNDWAASSLKMLLNDYYYNGTNESTVTYCYLYWDQIPSNCDFTKNGITVTIYRNMIANVTWKLGGYSSTAATALSFYSYERGTTVYSGRPTSTTGYIGLMYPSDYGYAVLASSCTRTTNLGDYNNSQCAGQNWLINQGNAWTLTPNSTSSNSVFDARLNGPLYSDGSVLGYSARPVLYLKSNVMKLSGDGSVSNPYIIIQ